MYKLFISLLLISFNLFCYCDVSVEENTELVLSFLVHRHGDRTPVESTLKYSNDPEALRSATAQYGYGQLTDVGRCRGYALGQIIRRRYNDVLSPQYNKSEIYIRSTDSTRTKMTVMSAMAAVYPAEKDNWSAYINWTPTPYTTVPAKYDFNLAPMNCPQFISNYYSILMTDAPTMHKYDAVLNKWSELTGLNFTSMPVLAYVYHDLYTSQISLGVSLGPELEAIFPEIEEVADAAIDELYTTEDNIVFQAGVLLNEFFTVADQIIAGEDVQRVHVYSAHDLNVYGFEAATMITPRQGVPDYASMYALEVRKVVATGEYVVVPVYLNTPDEDVITYLQVDGCGDLCGIESFRNLTSKYVLDEDKWRSLCGFSETYAFDTSFID